MDQLHKIKMRSRWSGTPFKAVQKPGANLVIGRASDLITLKYKYMKKSTPPRRRYALPPSLFKLFVIMKLTFFLIVLSVCQVHANVYGQGNITLNLQQTAIEKVLNKIEKTGGFRFLYNYDLKSLKKRLTLMLRIPASGMRWIKYFPIQTSLTSFWKTIWWSSFPKQPRNRPSV